MTSLCDVVYTLQMERMDRLDDLYVHAQYLGNRDPQDREFGVYRDALDNELLAPMGDAAEAEAELLRELNGG